MPQKLSAEEIVEYREAFQQFDKNGDGKISAIELTMVLESLGENFSEQDILNIIKIVDTNGDGVITFQDFVRMIEYYNETVETDEEEEFRLSFDFYDRNHDGFITPNELVAALSGLGENLSQEQLNDMFRSADSNGDGLIDYDEFKTILIHLNK